MSSYFYAHDYHIDNNGKPPLGAHARMYAIADKYGIPLLKDLALANFISMIEDIEDSKIIDVSTFVAAVDIIFSSTLSSDRGLRDAIVPALVQFKSDLRDSEEFVGLIAAGLGEGDFALEVIDAWGNVGRHAEAK